MSTEPEECWFVRYAGRITGPFDAERLRTMAARGQITGVHFLSTDRVHWKPATALAGILAGPAADGPCAIVPDMELEPQGAPTRGTGPVAAADVAPGPSPPPAFPAPDLPHLVSGTPVAACAAVLVLAAFTVSAAANAPAGPPWASDPAQQLRLALRILQALSALAALIVLSLPADTARAVTVAAASAVLALLSVLDASSVPWTAAAVASVPAAATLLTVRRVLSAASRPWAVLSIAIGAASGLVGVILAYRVRDPAGIEPLAFAGVAALGCIAIAVAGARTFGREAGASGSPFAWAATGIGLCVLSPLLHAAAAPGPEAREAAVAACMALGFSGLCWASAPAMARPSPGRA